LPGNEVRAPCRAARFGVIVRESHAFGCQPVEVRRLARHDPAMVGADIEPAYIVAHDDENIRRPLRRLLRYRGPASQSHGGNRQRRAETRDAADAHGWTLPANDPRSPL